MNPTIPIFTDHARARKGIPAESDAITILDIAPLVLQRLVIHLDLLRAGATTTRTVRGQGGIGSQQKGKAVPEALES
jgi:hypothetical protein